ncbi:hypothetical protein ACTT8P_33885, partial [Streptomyces sp. JW3]
TPSATPAPAPPRPSARPASPTPRPSLTPVHYPRHRAAPQHPRAPHGVMSPLVFVLLILIPALAAVVALRPR